MLFSLTFEGNLADDPELRIAPNGKAVTKLRIGHTRRRRNAAGEWVNATTMWVTVTAWEGLAERVAELKKGATVVVEARDDLSVWAYTNQTTNEPAGQLQVTAANISLSMRFKAATPVNANRPTGFDEQWLSEAETRELEPAF